MTQKAKNNPILTSSTTATSTSSALPTVKTISFKFPNSSNTTVKTAHHKDAHVNIDNSTVVSFWLSWRMLVVFIVFLGVNLYAIMRNIIGVTMICMVNATAAAFREEERLFSRENLSIVISGTTVNSSIQDEQVCKPSREIRNEYRHGDFDWSTEQQSFIIGGLFWGQLLAMFPAGLFGDKYHVKWLMIGCFAIGAVCMIAIPLVGAWGYIYVVGLRFILGLVSGAIWPCLSTLIGRWVPPSEMSTMYAIVTGGNQLSMVVMNPLSTYLCKQRHLLGGWPMVYYITGTCMLIWTLLWYFFVTDYPDQHKFVSKTELHYIVVQLRHSKSMNKQSRLEFKRPYKQIFFSTASLACVFSLTSSSWGITCIIYYLPTYLRDVMFMDLAQNGEFSAAPFLSQLIFKMLFSRLADRLKQTKALSPDVIVKSFNTLGMFSLAIFLFAMTFLNCNHPILALVVICISTGMYSAVTPGFLASSMLLAPAHAGLLIAWMNFVSSILHILLPTLVGVIVVNSTVEEYRIIFGIGAASQICSALFFLVFGRGQEQDWAKPRLLSDKQQQHFSPSLPPAVKKSSTDNGKNVSYSNPNDQIVIENNENITVDDSSSEDENTDTVDVTPVKQLTEL